MASGTVGALGEVLMVESPLNNEIVMVDAPPRTSLMDLPPELRCIIYGQVLKFDSPVRRIKSNAARRTKVDLIDVAIFSVCHRTYNESLPEFYKMNQMTVHHVNICLFNRGPLKLNRSDCQLLRHAHVVHWGSLRPWPNCEWCSTDVPLLLERVFDGEIFPKLKKISLDLDGFKGGEAAIGEVLLKHGIDVVFDFTDVGVMKLRNTRKTIEFRFGALWSTWRYYAALPSGHKELGFVLSWNLSNPAPLKNVPSRCIGNVQHLFQLFDIYWRSYRRELESRKTIDGFRSMFGMPPAAIPVAFPTMSVIRGINLAWLNPRTQMDADKCRVVTERVLEWSGM